MSDSDATNRDQPNSSNNPKGVGTLMAHINSHKIDFALWVTRILTAFFTISYLLLAFWFNPQLSYQRALISNAATSALRLHQRLPRVQFNRQFLAILMLEDSCHYLFYSLIFMYSTPVTLALLPIFLFAVLHSASYSLTLLDQLGQNSWWGARILISLVEFQQKNILRLIAFTEIFLMPLMIFMIFMGRASLLVPFVYYRFLSMRYVSRRNPYARNVFHELRMVTELKINHPSCPAVIRNFAHKIIGFVIRLAPPTSS
ncbi:Transmembrane protein 33 [Chamberlinius hualienensis]